jgi:hypothetical protein
MHEFKEWDVLLKALQSLKETGVREVFFNFYCSWPDKDVNNISSMCFFYLKFII